MVKFSACAIPRDWKRGKAIASAKLYSGGRAGYKEFINTVEWMKRNSDRDEIKLISQAFVAFGEAISRNYQIEERVAVSIKELNIEGVS